MNEPKYKCHLCHLIIPETELEYGNACPKCHSSAAVKKMCKNDTNDCSHDVVDGLAYCPECGEAMCPVCECHDVAQISRVTGYLQEVSGWNSGKQQELKDRHRVNIIDGSGMI